MSKRSEHMKEVNRLRSTVTEEIIYFLDLLENGDYGGYFGFFYWQIDDYLLLKGQLNSYRAQKIALLLGKNISKQKLLKYSKPKDYEYSLTNKELYAWLEKHEQKLRDYVNDNIRMETQEKRSLYD